MKTKDLILIALVCANVTLAALAVGLHFGKAEPAAYGMSMSKSGDYLMVTGPITSNREAILIIDVVAQRANLYMAKAAATAAGAGRWELADSRSLAADFGAGGPMKGKE